MEGAFHAETGRIEQDRPVFRDQAMAAVHRVGGGFPASRRGVGVGGNAPRALLGNERAAVVGLADQFVAGRRIEDEGGSGQRLTAARGDDAPQILAKFDADDHFPVRFEKQVRAEGDGGRPGKFDGSARNVPAAGKMALFVELPVVGQGTFGDDPPDGAVLKKDGGVEDAPPEADGRADDDDGPAPRAGGGDFAERLFASAEKIRLEEQIPAGISRDRQFGKKNDGSLFFDAPPDQADDLFRVETDVRDPQPGHGGCDPVKAEHGAPPFDRICVPGDNVPPKPENSTANSGKFGPKRFTRQLLSGGKTASFAAAELEKTGFGEYI